MADRTLKGNSPIFYGEGWIFASKFLHRMFTLHVTLNAFSRPLSTKIPQNSPKYRKKRPRYVPQETCVD